MKMSTQLCFFRDLDSLEVHANFLEVVHQAKTFRFAYPRDDSDARKFAVEMDKNVHVTLPEMTLEYQSEGVWIGTQVVGFCARFIDMVKFAAFLTKLSNIAGYQQLIGSNGNAPAKIERDPDVYEQVEFEDDEDGSQSDESEQNISMLPRYSVLQDYTTMTVTPQYIELVVTGQTHRFAHPPAPQALEFGRESFGLSRTNPIGKYTILLIPGVILQGLSPVNQQYVDLFPVDLYIEFSTAELSAPFANALKDNHIARYYFR